MKHLQPNESGENNVTYVPPSVFVESLMSNIDDAIVLSLLDRRVLVWNRGAELLFGYTAEEMIGKPFDLLVPEGARQEVINVIERLRSGETRIRYEAERLTKSGTAIEVEVSLSLIADVGNGEPGMLGITRNISKQRASERALATRLKQQAGVAWLAQQVLSEVDLDTLLDAAVSLVRRTLHVDFVKVLELKTGGEELVLRAGAGWQPGLVGGTVVKAGKESQAGFTLLSREPVIVEDLGAETRFRGPSLLLDHLVVSGLSTVIEGERPGHPYGVLGAHSRKQRHYSQDDAHFLQTVAALLATAIRQSRASADRLARVRAEEHLQNMQVASQQRSIVLEAANRVALDILSSRTGVEALNHIAEAARVLAGARYAALGVAYVDKPGLEQFITSGLTPGEEARIGNLPRGLGVLGALLEQERPLRIDDLSKHPASVGFPPNHPPMVSFLGVPIRRGNVTLGSLYLTNKQSGGSFTEEDEAAVSALGAYAAVAIHNLRMLSRQRELTRSLLTAQEEERRAVAHDLHDGLTQYVMASHAHLEAFKRAHAVGDETKAFAQVEKGMGYLQEAVVESRRMINNLRLLVLDDLGLTGAIGQLLREEISRAHWEETDLEENIGDDRFDVAVETAVYRVVQETLTNARKYAETKRVQVSLTKLQHGTAASLRVIVRDWGKGFTIKEGPREFGHFGLQGMLERVHLLNGIFDLDSQPGMGTTVTVTLPL